MPAPRSNRGGFCLSQTQTKTAQLPCYNIDDMGHYRRHHLHGGSPKTIGFWRVYPLSLFFVFHLFLVAYINSSYMERFVSPEGVGALYTIGSAVGVLAFLFFSHALKVVGNVKLTLVLAIINGLSLLTLGLVDDRATAILAFVAFLIVNPLLYLNIDIFSETLIGKKENSTGHKRGLTLGLMSIAGVIAPLVMGIMVDGTDNLSQVYLVSTGILSLFIVWLLFAFSNFTDPDYDIFKIRTSLNSMWKKADIRNVMFSHFLLQVFFAWTIIYFPLYLYSELGFTWDSISYIIAFALFAYVIIEWPVGIIADRWLGEKELMALGFLILAISTSWISFVNTSEIWPWMVLFFITRVGAALVESTTEIYFFKHSNGDDADTISFFRLLRPLAAVVGALIGSATLLYLPFHLIFAVFGLLLVPGIYFANALRDTK